MPNRCKFFDKTQVFLVGILILIDEEIIDKAYLIYKLEKD